MKRIHKHIHYGLIVVVLSGFLLVGTVVAQTLSGSTSQPTQPQITQTNTSAHIPTPGELLIEINKARATAGVSGLTEDPRLDASAQAKTDDMQTNGYYGHIDKNGRQGYDLAHSAMPECLYTGEVLDGANTASEAVSEWLASPAHHDAILASKYNYTGFGVTAHEGYYFIAEHLCDVR